MRAYPVSEDTILLLQNLRCGERVLDMGTGNGEIAIECAKRGAKVVAVDIDVISLKELKERINEEKLRNIEIIQSDLFENIAGKFDTIIFNPPYLPGDAKTIEDCQWAGGGKYGDKIIIRFLRDAWRYLKDNGEIYIILSSFNRIQKIKKMNYDFSLLAKRKFSFHEIYLYRAVYKDVKKK